MASSSISMRRRNVTFTNRPPQIVRYSYHAGPDASTSLTFGSSSAVGKFTPMISSSSEPMYQNTNTNNTDTSSSVSSSPPPPIYDHVPPNSMSSNFAANNPLPAAHSPKAIISAINNNNNNNNFKIPFRDIPPRKLPLLPIGKRFSNPPPSHLVGGGNSINNNYRWANDEGIEKIDVIEKNNSGVTHVNIGESNNKNMNNKNSKNNFYANEEVQEEEDDDEEMAMHLYECIEQFNTACDKILGARQLIDTDTSLTSTDRDKLLRLVNKSITTGRGRLDTFDSSQAPSVPSSNRTTTLSGGTGSNVSMSGIPSQQHLASPSPTPSEPRISIDANFINRYGPQIMHLLQENMSKQN